MIRSGLITSLKTLCNIYRNSFTKDTVYKSLSSKIKDFSIWKLGGLLSIVVPKCISPTRYQRKWMLDLNYSLSNEPQWSKAYRLAFKYTLGYTGDGV